MSTTAAAALITGAKVPPYIDTRPDIKNIANLCEKNGFRISDVLVNTEELSKHPKRKIYGNKREYRETFIDFLSNSENFLIYFYSGHGNHQWNESKKNNSECLCIMYNPKDWYSDEELTKDIDEYLPYGKTLYVLLDTCHGGGMINAWQLDTRLEKSVVFFCGANSEILAWDDEREDAVGGLFTNSFCLHAKVGCPLWEIADKVLVEMFTPYQKNARSPSVRYSRPAVAIEKFCQTSADGYLTTKGDIRLSKFTGVNIFLNILDTDRDHRISRRDFEIALDKRLNAVRKPDDIRHLRECVLKLCNATGLDMAGNVSYSYELYRTHLQAQLNNPHVEQACQEIFEAYFDYLDVDRTGYVTAEEYHAFMTTMGCTDESESNTGFTSLDKSNNGKISREEWIKSSLEFFTSHNTESKMTVGSHFINRAVGCTNVNQVTTCCIM